MNEYKVSIITPVHNAERFIRGTYESIANQTYENWEWICVDDCSDDDSYNILRELAKLDNRIVVHCFGANQGAAIARNKAIELAKGRFIAFLDCDDIWTPNKLEVQIPFMLKCNAILSHTSYGFIDENNNKLKGDFIVGQKNINYQDLLKYCDIGCLTAIYDSDLTGKVYMPNLRKRQDYALWLKILRYGGESKGMKDVLAYYRVFDGSLSNNKWGTIKYQWKVVRNVEKQPFLKSCYYMSQWALNGINKYYLK